MAIKMEHHNHSTTLACPNDELSNRIDCRNNSGDIIVGDHCNSHNSIAKLQVSLSPSPLSSRHLQLSSAPSLPKTNLHHSHLHDNGNDCCLLKQLNKKQTKSAEETAEKKSKVVTDCDYSTKRDRLEPPNHQISHRLQIYPVSVTIAGSGSITNCPTPSSLSSSPTSSSHNHHLCQSLNNHSCGCCVPCFPTCFPTGSYSPANSSAINSRPLSPSSSSSSCSLARATTIKPNPFSSLNKMLIVSKLYLFLMLLLISILIVLFVNKANSAPELCLTKDCIQEAAKILNSIDPSVSPCEDFYSFSCGKWTEETIMPDHIPSRNIFSEVQDRQDVRLRDLIEEPINEENDPDFVQKMKNLYQSCMNLTAIDQKGDEPLLNLIDELGGWPVLQGSDWDDSDNMTVLEMYRRLYRLGLVDDMLTLVTVIPHSKNFTRSMLAISSPNFDLLDREFMSNEIGEDIHVQTYYSLMLHAVQMMMDRIANNDTIANSNIVTREFPFDMEVVEKMVHPRIIEEMKPVLQFEQTLANNSIKDVERQNISTLYNNMTVESLQKLSPNIPWLELINIFTINNITKDDEILVVDLNYTIFLSEQITKIPKRVLINYIVWRVVQTKMSVLDSSWRNLMDNFNIINLGQSRPPPHWINCVSNVQSNMGTALSNIYVKNYFSGHGKEAIDKIVRKILTEFRLTLEKTDWMDNKTKQKAIEKLEAMNFRIGYPDELLDNKLVSEFYRKLSITGDNFFQNLINIRRYSNYLKFANISDPNRRDDWRTFSEVVEVNAYYFQQMNTFILNAGILQDIFFNPSRPNYLNYGSIGEIIGHEITHGFDSTGKQFDINGHIDNWWNPETARMFDQKASCIEKQYNQYSFDEVGLNVNGHKTQDENIADNGGVGLAYRAYRRSYSNRYGMEPLLPALNYTAEQLFWISYGIGECEKMTDEVLKLRIVTDSHAPNKYRLIGVVSNSRDFARDFNCPLGSPMNPEDKCKVW